MPNIFDIDFSIQQELLICPSKRGQVTLDLMRCVADELQYSRDIILGDYKVGATYSAYSGATTYNQYDRVIFTDKGVYEARTITVGIDPAGDPLSATNWSKKVDLYIGVDERKMYNGVIGILTRALNKWFGATSPALIYLVNNNTAGSGFDLYVPLALYNALGPTNPERSRVIFQFTEKYAVAGQSYAIVTY